MRSRSILTLCILGLASTAVVAQTAVANHETVQSTGAMTGSFVPAFKKCNAPNHSHAAPANLSSCQTPGGATSSHVGGDNSSLLIPREGDFNPPEVPGFTGSYDLHVVNEGTASVDIETNFQATRVYCESNSLWTGGASGGVALANCGDDDADGQADKFNVPSPGWAHGQFEGVLITDLTIRLTDHDNCTSPCENGTLPGTVQDALLRYPFDCVAGTCNSSSSLNAELPGLVVNSKREVWDILAVALGDPGPDGNPSAVPGCPIPCATGDDKDFLDTGLFAR
jgi:hypothetical protein